jgi:uncharacterized protein (DUF2236 family)
VDFLPFSPDSMLRRVHQEGVLLLGGGRALLMQIAHPLVARGVAEHSSFKSDRIGRLLRTLRPMFAIAFGTKEQALAAAASVRRRHAAVNGDAYRAEDADLLLWVLATLIDTTLLAQKLFVRPLSQAEASAYYADMMRVGMLLGVPPDIMPADLAAFEGYVRQMVGSLAVTDEARLIARAIFAGGLPLAVPLRAVEQLTAGLLPPRLREGFGLSWSPRRQAGLDAACRALRLLRPAVPARLRLPPPFLLPTGFVPA